MQVQVWGIGILDKILFLEMLGYGISYSLLKKIELFYMHIYMVSLELTTYF